MYQSITCVVRLALLVPCLLTVCISTSASGAPLFGAGNHLPIPNPNPGMPMFCPPTINAIGSSGFTGTWTSPAESPWHGTFVATGPVPSSQNQGTTTYNFAGLRNGVLPAGTFLLFGDVDGGSGGNEQFNLVARDRFGSFFTRDIRGPWLDEPIGVWGTGTGAAGAIQPNDMPGWEHDPFPGFFPGPGYSIDGRTQGPGGNPTISFALRTNVAIDELQIRKFGTNYSFGIAAPCIPEPSTLILAALTCCAPALSRRTRTPVVHSRDE